VTPLVDFDSLNEVIVLVGNPKAKEQKKQK
jgi:hypothetical protein